MGSLSSNGLSEGLGVPGLLGGQGQLVRPHLDGDKVRKRRCTRIRWCRPSGLWLLRAWNFIHWAMGSLAGAGECNDAGYLLEEALGPCNTRVGGCADRRQHGENIGNVLPEMKEMCVLSKWLKACCMPGMTPGHQLLKTLRKGIQPLSLRNLQVS